MACTLSRFRHASEPVAGHFEQVEHDSLKRAQAKQALVEKERAAAEAAAQKPEEKPIVIQQGISDSSPVTLEDKPNESGEVVVEEGLPGDAVRDQAEASAVDGPGQSSPAPARKGGGKKR